MGAQVKRVSVRDVMKTEFTTIDRQATIYEALLKIKKYRTSVLVVEKRDENDEFGILLVGDIARQVLAKDRSSKRVNVYEVMIKPAVCVHPNMDIRYCSRLFARFGLVRALVVENRQVLGTISPNSLVLDGMYDLEEDQ
ncbi:MAG: CBS domain-containing protein [Chromatiaceae bacterium]|nr:CBS domain-containing protein [Gammaproteobacteria bacterium]MCB1860931.1 CBS domain-containing protein [Gammaproteobacteria bacterium]MCB1905684.1 CBS domain-containing protein [Gammaproteobacteria bacterium]MCP5427878.1 CBS domain-containing protein [Chromatiaceae bacterium]MCP5445851.1 CBS domain-containing protein [Chromatiaceae bacterium]